MHASYGTHASSGHMKLLQSDCRESLYVPSFESWVTTLKILPQSWPMKLRGEVVVR